MNKSNYQKWCELFMLLRDGSRNYIGLVLTALPVMMTKLIKYDHKPNWNNVDRSTDENIDELWGLLVLEMSELREAIDNRDLSEISNEAGDVANLACMIIDCNEFDQNRSK